MRRFPMLAIAALALPCAALATDQPPLAKKVFAPVAAPAPGAAQVFGGYAKGCLAGAVALPADGPGWSAMRPSRGRNWGHPALVGFIERMGARAQASGRDGLLIGDMGRARGGPMVSGHRSHQTGLDVDVWLRPRTGIPTRAQRESVSSTDLVQGRYQLDADAFDRSAWPAIRWAAEDAAVARIFVNAAIKRKLCAITPPGDRAWLRKVRAWWGHDAHFHVRLACPAGSPACVDQPPVPAGDGCGEELAWWFTAEPYDDSGKKPAELTMADLPVACAAVVAQ